MPDPNSPLETCLREVKDIIFGQHYPENAEDTRKKMTAIRASIVNYHNSENQRIQETD